MAFRIHDHLFERPIDGDPAKPGLMGSASKSNQQRAEPSIECRRNKETCSGYAKEAEDLGPLQNMELYRLPGLSMVVVCRPLFVVALRKNTMYKIHHKHLSIVNHLPQWMYSFVRRKMPPT